MSQNTVQLKKATLKDYDSYYAIRSEEINLFWTGYEKAPDYEKFSNWYSKRLSEENRELYLLFQNKTCIGSLNVDYYDNIIFIGYSIKENQSGKGYGTFLVQKSIEIAKANSKIQRIKAWINFQNNGSMRVVEKNGFRKNGVTEIRKRFGKDELYYQYSLEL